MFLNRAAKKCEFSVGSGSRPLPSCGSGGDTRGVAGPFWGGFGDRRVIRPRPLLGAGERLGPEGGIFEFGHGGGPETLFPSPTFFFGP